MRGLPMPSSDPPSLGRRIADAVNDYGIGGYILDVSGSADEGVVRIVTPIYDSEDRPALTEDGADFARVLWEVPMNSTRP